MVVFILASARGQKLAVHLVFAYDDIVLADLAEFAGTINETFTSASEPSLCSPFDKFIINSYPKERKY